jgi:hypothetical protein
MTPMNSLWTIFKQTFLEKNTDTPIGSIKRGIAWVLVLYAGEIINAGLLPGGSIHIGTFLNLSWNHKDINLDSLKVVLAAIGTYVLTGQMLSNVTDTIQHRNTVKYGGDDTTTTPTNTPANTTTEQPKV